MATKKGKNKQNVLYARGISKDNLQFIKIESIKGSFENIGDYLNNLFDKMRKKKAKRAARD